MVKYKVLECKNSLEKDLKVQYYAKAVTHEAYKMEDLSELIADHTTVTETNIVGVLQSLERNNITQIRKENLVQMVRLVSLQLSLKSLGRENHEGFSGPNLLVKHIFFRPEKRFRDILQLLRLRKVA